MFGRIASRSTSCLLPKSNLSLFEYGTAVHPLTNHSFCSKSGKKIDSYSLIFIFKLSLKTVNLPAYMNIIKAPLMILSDILISATVSTRYPLAVALGYGAFPV